MDEEDGEVAAAARAQLASADVVVLPPRADELRALVAGGWDVVLLAWSARPRLSQLAPVATCVVVAPPGVAAAEIVAVIRAGAADVVAPEELARLDLVLARVRPDHRALFRWAVESENVGVWILDANGATRSVNARMAEMLGYAPSAVAGRHVLELVAPDDHAAMKERLAVFPRGATKVHLVRSNGARCLALLESTPILDGGALVTATDITAWRDAEQRYEALLAQLRQSQKMEAVGRLAGGVAHDFNNMLSVILGYGDTLLERVADLPDVREDVEEVMTAGRRAAELTRQLLVFSRHHLFQPVVVDLAALLEGMEKMLARVVGEDVELVCAAAALREAPLVRVDRSGFEQVLMNLVVNARDAMPTGGKLTIGLAERGTDALVVSVTDTGCGMDAATTARVFEPFFTTKEQGKGTGLGLSTAHAFVDQAGGTIHVASAPGAGTRFEIVLPRTRRQRPSVAAAAPPAIAPAARATVLLVEDDDQVRAVTRRALERQGHRVVEAKSPLEALARDATEVDLLLTDVVMPQMGGAELARRLTGARPSLKVLFMSGYNDDNVVRHGVVMDAVAYLQKPFTPAELAEKVRAALERPALTGAA
ncbi:MAG: response regulator [Labilithrix sp.]|nr:response regulator [Labilithrix sp.]MCW5816219.1 response regulator [Labilithrix sp.]